MATRVPILKLGEFLIATAQEELSDSGWDLLRQELLRKAGENRSQGVIVDITVMDVVDSFASRTLRDMVLMLRLRGAKAVIVGIQPEVAFSMAQLGLKLEGVVTALDLEEGMEVLKEQIKLGRDHGR